MSFDYKLLGRKLKEARENLKIGADEAARYIGVSIDEYIGLEEVGIPPINGDKLVMLSKLYVTDFRYFVTGNYKSAESQIKEMFRKNANLTKGDRIAIQQFVRICEYKHLFEGLIGREKPNPFDYSRSNLYGTVSQQGKAAAAMERKRLNINGPIDNLFKLLREQRINVFRRRLEDRSVSGVYVRHPRAGHCILINFVDDLYRQNFSAAHEYCHVLFDSEKEQNVSYFQEKKQSIETRANSFAAHFLVPDEELKKIGKPDFTGDIITTIIKLCHYFKVSGQTMCIRLADVGWISKSLKIELLNNPCLRIPKKDKADPELFNVSSGAVDQITSIIEGGLSVEYMELCRNAYQENHITYGKMIEALMLPFETGKEITDLHSVFMEV